jgi:quercetin dioxygenase-like cupin family protein
MPPDFGAAEGRDEMFRLWIEGGFGSERFGRVRCVVTHANLQPAVACYQCRPGDSTWRALALEVLRIEDGLITEIVVFPPDSFPAFRLRDLAVKGGQPVAVVGPLELPPAKSYTAVLSYAVMRPGDRSRVHTHPGPEGWYMIVGEQCLETPAGANRAKAGGTMTVPPNVPMELSITGTVVRKSLVLVIHDSSQPRGTPSQWKPAGACSQ